MRERAALLAACREAPDVGEREELVARLEALQTLFLLAHACYDLGFNASLITAEQFAALLVASYPYIPSPTAVHEALFEIRRARGPAGAAAGGGEESGAAGEEPSRPQGAQERVGAGAGA
jgi:hypothetical protein